MWLLSNNIEILWNQLSIVTCIGPQPSRLITDYRLSETRSIFADEMYSTTCVEWAADRSGLGLS